MGAQLSGQYCVAIIGDDEAVQNSTVGLLKRAGYRVVLFTDGTEFLASGLPEDLCCILLDMRMLGMDGLSMMRALREREVTVPILVLTSDGDIPLAVEAMRLSAFFLPCCARSTDAAGSDDVYRHARSDSGGTKPPRKRLG